MAKVVKSKIAKPKPTVKKVSKEKAVPKKTVQAVVKPIKKVTKASSKEKPTGEISVNGNKLLSTLQAEFSKKFNYMFLAFIKVEDKDKIVNIRSLDTSKTISESRTIFSNKDLSLNGRTLVKNMENSFLKDLGIACQIAVFNYKSSTGTIHPLYFPKGDYFNNSSLTKANEWAKRIGCIEVKDIKSLSKKTVF